MNEILNFPGDLWIDWLIGSRDPKFLDKTMAAYIAETGNKSAILCRFTTILHAKTDWIYA